MKKLSKFLAALLAMTMLVGMVSFSGSAAGFSDLTSDNKNYEAIMILSGLGIITGYEDGTFGPAKDVTRAEFATMLMRAMASAGIGSTDAAGTPFTDISGHWAISDIRTAYDLGIINGMTLTTFEPNSNVTYEQALKMIVCALNYGEQALSVQSSLPNQPWYYGYVQSARQLGITDNIIVLEGQPAKRADIAQMIYNGLDVKMLEKIDVSGATMYMESTQTWLKDKLKVTKSRGELLADESNTLSADGSTARTGYALFKDEVNGGTITLAKNGISLDGLLGKSVEYYYKTNTDGEKVLVLAYSKSGSNESLIVDASNLYKISGSYDDGYTVEYYSSSTASRTSQIKVSAKPVISVNGEVKTDIYASDLVIESGQLEFISDGGVYNKINVTSYETYVVKSVNKTDKYIVDMYRSSGSNSLYIDDEDNNYTITMKNSSGSAITISNLAQYNVLTVKRGKGSAGRTTLDISVSSKTVSGTIKELDSEFIDINGTNYYISAYLNNYGEKDLSAFDIGDSCKAYLDSEGKIAYITKTVSSSTFFGYIASASIAKDDTVRFALISQKTTTMGSPYVTAASKVKIDGISYSDPDEILEVLEESAAEENTNVDGNGTKYSQLVKYTINSSGLITEIDTAVVSEKEDADDETIVKTYEVTRKSGNLMQYTSSNSNFVGASSSDKFRINSSTQVFLVPLDRTDFDSYGRKSNTFFKDSVSYIVEPYNVTGSLNIAEALVVYETAATAAVVEYSTPLFMITSISQSKNSEDDSCDKVVGYQISASGAVTEDKEYYTDSTNVIYGEYSVGDIIMFVTDNKGYINEDTIIDVLDADSFNAGFEHVTDSKTDSTAYYCELYQGLLMGADDSGLFDLAIADEPADCEDADVYSLTAPSSTKYFVYDSSLKDSEKISKQDSFDLTSLACYNDTDGEDAAKLFVYRYNKTVRMIVIIK